MKRKIRRYKVNGDESLCMAVSVVDKPAVESDFQFFGQQKIENFVGVDGERRMIYGCALRPDFPIYRNNGEEEYYLEFSKEAVDKISKNYFKMGFQANWTEAHKDEVEGLTVTEAWLKEDMEQDKSVALGLDPNLPIGSWFIGCYCENDDIWQAVKENRYHGFSIEAIIGVEEFERDAEKEVTINMNDMGFWARMKELINEVLGKKEQVEDMEAQTTTETVTETPIQTVEETPTAIETPTETPATTEAETPNEEPKTEQPKEESNDNHVEELINNLTQEIKALKELNSELTTKVNDLSKRPSTKRISTTPSNGNNGNTFDAWRETMRGLIG